MSKRKLKQYRGQLGPAQIATGMNAAIDTAKDLLEAANFLFDKGCFSVAAALAILSIEESGKTNVLRGLALASTEEEVERCWRDYRTHTKKNIHWLDPQIIAEGARKLEDFRAGVQPGAEHPFVLDQLKQLALYTDCLGASHWSVPQNAIDKELAAYLLKTAESLIPKRKVTRKEIVLWVKHMGPVSTKSMDEMKQALIQWAEAMEQNGLYETGHGDLMKAFVYTGLTPDHLSNTEPAEPSPKLEEPD